MSEDSEFDAYGEANSSPIAIQHDEGEISIRSRVADFDTKKAKKKTNSKKKTISDDSEDVSLWSQAKRIAWQAIDTNPNAFFYRHVAPGQRKKTGAWDTSEKELFMNVIKVHPPSQGKWGLFAQHIPGRVGYQCRNFYHRLLESGELTALPEEIEKMKRPRKNKTTPKMTVVPQIDEEEVIQLQDDNESTATDEEEEEIEEKKNITPSEVESLVLFSTRLNQYYEENGLEKLVSPTIPNEQEDDVLSSPICIPSEAMPSEINQVVSPPTPIVAEQFDKTEELFDQGLSSPISIDFPDNNYIIEPEPEPTSSPPPMEAQEEVVLKWHPRMKAPWRTLKNYKKPEVVEKPKQQNPAVNVQPIFEYEASQILRCNKENPLNYILFGFPIQPSNGTAYINSVRSHLSMDSQKTKDQLIHDYFKCMNQCERVPNYRRQKISNKFVDKVIESSPC